MICLGIVIVLQIRLFSISNTFSFFLLFSIGFTLGFYILLWLLMSLIGDSELYDTITETIYNPQLYIYITVILALVSIEYIWIKMEFFNFNSDLVLKEDMTQKQYLTIKNPDDYDGSEEEEVIRSERENDIMDDYRDSEDSESD